MYGVDEKTLKAICKLESDHNPYVINVNESIFDIQRGSHRFDTWIGANLYMDTILDPLGLNYDIGICQINEQHLQRLQLDNEHLLDAEKNIEIAARIYRFNLKECEGDRRCALSMYNTGYKNSTVGMRYADRVERIMRRL